MPTTYAHYHFGQLCIKTLPSDLQEIINKNIDVYNTGLHGPDIFFYTLGDKDITTYGSNMHLEAGRVFFEKSIETLNQFDNQKEAMLAYVLGFLSHFAFDCTAHAYVNTKDAIKYISHNRIEAEYDAYLIQTDGKKVNKTNRANYLYTDEFVALITSRFFPFDELTMLKVIKNQKLIIRFLHSRNQLSRNIKAFIMRKMGMPAYAELLVPNQISPDCYDSNLRLDKLKLLALDRYPLMVDSYMKALNNEEVLNQYYDQIFDPKCDESIPVLDYKEELQYILEGKVL